jgi:RNA polymerase sigma-70 factor (ECF subfamily)
MPFSGGTLLTAFYREHGHWLYGQLRRRAGSPETAADIVQDTFTRLLARERDLSDVQQPRAYLMRIARGLLANHWRRQDIERAYRDALASEPDAVAVSPEDQQTVIEALRRIDKLLDGLPGNVRTAFLRSRLEGATYGTIAGELGVSERMVKKYMAQAVAHCLRAAEGPGDDGEA